MWNNNEGFNKTQTGQFFEELAQRFLHQQGMETIEKNVNFKVGELDLVMKDKNYLVFVEVRYRASQQFGGAVTSITPSKQRRLIKAAQLYLQKHFGNRPPPCRFDVIAFEGEKEAPNWIKNALA